MRSALRIALFLTFFLLEMTVHAEPKAKDHLEEPAACLTSEGVCAVQSLSSKGFRLELGETHVTLDEGASVIRKSKSEVRLVAGTIWVQGALIVETEVGRIEGADEMWVQKSDQGVTVMVVRGLAKLKPRGSSETLEVHEGLQNTIGDVGFNGIAQTGLPLPIAFKDFVLRWGRLTDQSKSDFESSVDRFHAKWSRASALSAETNRLLFERKRASLDADARSAEEKATKAQASENALRQMFRKRMLEGL